MGAKGFGATFGGVEVALWEVEGSGQVGRYGWVLRLLSDQRCSEYAKLKHRTKGGLL